MSTRLLSRPLRYSLAALAAAACLLVLVDRALAPLSARALSRPTADVILTSCTSLDLANAMNTLNGTSGGTIGFNCDNVNAPATITVTQAGGFDVTTNSSYTIDGGSVITLTGADTNRVFSVSSGAAFTLTNLTLVKGYSDGGDGGAIANAGTLTIIDSKFFSNTTSSDWSGGAIMSTGALTITGSEFAYNRAGNGGVLYPRFNSSTTTIKTSNFHDNQTTNTTNGWGGAMLIWDGAPVSIDTTNFVSNAALSGGAVYVFANSALTLSKSGLAFNAAMSGGGGGLLVAGTALITGTTIYSNTGVNPAMGGGGINMLDASNVTINHSTIVSNTAVGSPGGGIASHGRLTITQSALNGNMAAYGGGIYNLFGAMLSDSTLSGNSASSDGGGFYNGSQAILSNVTLNDNSASGNGGGISNFVGVMTLNNSTLSDNSANYGGGISNSDTVGLNNSTLSGNSGTNGGGIYNFGMVTLSNSTLNGNSAQTNGGGIDNFNGSVWLSNSTLSNNSATSGGGIENNSFTALMDVTLSGNSADNGGGFYNGVGGSALLSNSTLSGNSARNGGGIYNSTTYTMTLTNVTLHNSVPLTGTAHNLYLNSGVISLTNTLVDFAAVFGANCFGGGLPKIASGGHNAVNDTSCGLLGPADQQGPLVPILLGPLANHGGPTLMQLPRHGSAAIDHGNNAVCAAAPINNVDQRGVLRPLDGDGDAIAICDIGAVERQPSDSDLVPWLYLPLILR